MVRAEVRGLGSGRAVRSNGGVVKLKTFLLTATFVDAEDGEETTYHTMSTSDLQVIRDLYDTRRNSTRTAYIKDVKIESTELEV